MGQRDSEDVLERGAPCLGLMPWSLVARRYSQISGERLSRARVWQIGQQALKKIECRLTSERGIPQRRTRYPDGGQS